MSNTTLTLSLAQMQIYQKKPHDNLQKIECLMRKSADAGSQVIVFPEMCTTGFDWNFNQTYNHAPILDEICSLAKKYHLFFIGSFLSKGQKKPKNTLHVISPDGDVLATYSKTHLFSPLHEHHHVEAGHEIKTFDFPWGKAGFAICYDLRFPELFRSYALMGVQMIFLTAAFPHPRIDHWRTLLKARAIENQYFVIAVNQVGVESFTHTKDQLYFGSSMVIDPWGIVVNELSDKEHLKNMSLDLSILDEVRKKIPVFQDRKPELYQLAEPPHE